MEGITDIKLTTRIAKEKKFGRMMTIVIFLFFISYGPTYLLKQVKLKNRAFLYFSKQLNRKFNVLGKGDYKYYFFAFRFIRKQQRLIPQRQSFISLSNLRSQLLIQSFTYFAMQNTETKSKEFFTKLPEKHFPSLIPTEINFNQVHQLEHWEPQA